MQGTKWMRIRIHITAELLHAQNLSAVQPRTDIAMDWGKLIIAIYVFYFSCEKMFNAENRNRKLLNTTKKILVILTANSMGEGAIYTMRRKI